MGTVQLANELNVLAAGAYPVWTETEFTGTLGSTPTKVTPTTTAQGAALDGGAGATQGSGALKAIVLVRPRLRSDRRQADLTITYASGTTYRVNVAATNVDTNATTDLKTTIAAISSNLNANSTVAAAVTATAVDANGDGDVDTVQIVGDTDADFALSIEITAGTGTIAAEVDAKAVEGRVWLLEGGEASSRDADSWVPHWDQPFATALDWRGGTKVLDVGGYSRIYVELYDLAAASDVAGTGGTITVRASARIGVGQVRS